MYKGFGMDMEFNIGGGYSLNYPLIVKQDGIMAVTKLLAHRMMDNPYIVVGEYIESISDADLQSLVDAIEDQEYSDVILMSEMLATGEGCEPSPDFNGFQKRADMLVSLLMVESLGRKGLIKAYRENYSFHEDMSKKVVAEKIDGLDYDSFFKE